MPNEKKIDAALREVVQELQANDESDELTVNNVRALAGERLGVDEDFFRQGAWKEKSKAIIREEASKEPEPTPSRTDKSKPDKSKPAAKRKRGDSADRQTKLAKKKQAVKDNKDNEDSDSGTGETEHIDESHLSSDADDKSSPVKQPAEEDGGGSTSESELSVLLDDEPAPKKRAKKSGDRKSAKEDAKASKPKKESGASDPDQEEIKRLQGWLVKCGIRKLWGKELAPYESKKSKINHLRQMLADAGMTGRYSQDKARQIKEARELAADLEAVQEGNKMWGTATEDKDSADEEPPQRSARNARVLDFITDSESE